MAGFSVANLMSDITPQPAPTRPATSDTELLSTLFDLFGVAELPQNQKRAALAARARPLVDDQR